MSGGCIIGAKSGEGGADGMKCVGCIGDMLRDELSLCTMRKADTGFVETIDTVSSSSFATSLDEITKGKGTVGYLFCHSVWYARRFAISLSMVLCALLMLLIDSCAMAWRCCISTTYLVW